MSTITDNFKALAEEKQIQFKVKEIPAPIRNKEGETTEQQQLLFQSALRVTKDKPVGCAVIIHDAPLERVNYQITYNKIGYVTDRNKLPDILTQLNELNAMKSGYFRFLVSGDGELFMRYLGITGEDVNPVMDVFVFGGRILRALLPELEKMDGLDLTPKKG
ncbi:hypothetical protein [Marinilactibacillus sp. Marseille-P9653]|uniref:hypothetical protein n=1 Tax=Marinilactibacillus sp. Marseille-P9653 TaxID=2866583 RepID=UPI001CE4291D|nr:hypothetical protein [Marinilactibacillus sp. Marseille-P9653]